MSLCLSTPAGSLLLTCTMLLFPGFPPLHTQADIYRVTARRPLRIPSEQPLHSLASPPSDSWKGQIVTRLQRHPLSLPTSILQTSSANLGFSAWVAQSQRPKTWLRQSPATEAMMGHQGGQYSACTQNGLPGGKAGQQAVFRQTLGRSPQILRSICVPGLETVSSSLELAGPS